MKRLAQAWRVRRFRTHYLIIEDLVVYARRGTLNWRAFMAFWGEAGYVLDTKVGRQTVQRWLARHGVAFSDLAWMNQYPASITDWGINQAKLLLKELRQDLEQANLTKKGMLVVYLTGAPMVGFYRAMVPLAEDSRK